jgi:hypothetical protein
MLRRPTPASSTHVPANSRPFNRMHGCARAKNADVNGHVNGRANATVRRWNVAYGGPYYDYVPGISFGIGIGPVGIGVVRPGAGSYLKAPKPAATSAYLTASEIFPLETRALVIACFYALGTAIGAASHLCCELLSRGQLGG